MFKRLRMAFGFLTILPVKTPAEFTPGDLGRAAAWYAPVGLVLGGLLLVGSATSQALLPRLVAAVVVTALWGGLTGGLHLDGWADCCDGLLNASAPARRLEIMKDPRLGTFGGAGLVLLLLAKFAAIASLPALPAGGWVLLLAPTAARWLLMSAGFSAPARPGGLGADFRLGFKPWMFIINGALTLAVAAWGGWAGLACLAAGALAALGLNRLAVNRLGGVTGDVMGATVELVEVVILLAASAFLGRTAYGL
jgi:adenosylcobinamide-GDP ribazoletransferase